MTTSIIKLDNQLPRTNSLGWAKTSCWNCVKSGLRCDRARPRCSTCIDQGILCGGYKLDLKWQPGIVSGDHTTGFTSQTAGSSAALHSSSSSTMARQSASKKRSRSRKGTCFKFVSGGLRKKRKPRISRPGHKNDMLSTFTSQFHAESESPRFQSSPLEASHQVSTQDGGVEAAQDAFMHDLVLHAPQDLDAHPDLLVGSQSICFPEAEHDQLLANQNVIALPGEDQTCSFEVCQSPMIMNQVSPEDPIFTTGDLSPGFLPGISPVILYDSLPNKFQVVLAQYDQYICAIPLTTDCNLNPFRVGQGFSNSSNHLLHAVLATSFYHLMRDRENAESSDLMNKHKVESLHLYSRALSDSSCKHRPLALLDTALLLICLESTQSALGSYHIHLNGVRSILEAAGVDNAMVSNNPKLRAQLAMFIWYDTTIALISREPAVLPAAYLETILTYSRYDGWDYMNFTGCREEFLVLMAKIATLVIQRDIAQNYEWLTFDMTPVNDVEEVLRKFEIVPPSYDSNLNEEELSMALDRYHCHAAWRDGLILYITRVFRWQRHENPVQHYVRFLARNIISHARSIREDVTYQKQVLIPIFLAGAETQTETEKDFIRAYCVRWSRSCGFRQFNDVQRYLEEIWKENMEEGVWWATIIDRNRKREKARTESSMLPQVLLG